MLIQLKLEKKKFQQVPNYFCFYNWLNSLTMDYDSRLYVVIKIVNSKTMLHLNQKYRGINKVTNVLSFPAKHYENNFLYLGDIVLCYSAINKECTQQNLNYYAHWEHLLIHSFLHLANFKHKKKNSFFFMNLIEKITLKYSKLFLL